MKKLLILPLFVGVFSACFAFSGPVTIHTAHVYAVPGSFADAQLDQIFNLAIPQFHEYFGVTVSLHELRQGYQDGTVTVTYNGTDRYYVILSGGEGISVLEDSF